MAALKVLIGFSSLRDDDMDTKTANIIKNMTGNVNYVTPVPTLPVVQTSLTAYEAALAAAQSGGPEKTAIKDQKRSRWTMTFSKAATSYSQTLLASSPKSHHRLFFING